jgi:hypothetical protein
VSDEDKKTILNSADGLGKMDRKVMMGEFKKGLDKEDVDPREYMKAFRDLGLLDSLFPGKMVDADLPKELSELGDKHMPLAWMLRMNDPASLEDLGLDPEDTNKIGFLMKTLGMAEGIDPQGLSELTQGYLSSGVPRRKLREFAIKLGHVDADLMDAFLAHAGSPRVRVYTQAEDGSEALSEKFNDLADPFTGVVDALRLDMRKKEMEYQNFRKHLKSMRPG